MVVILPWRTMMLPVGSIALFACLALSCAGICTCRNRPQNLLDEEYTAAKLHADSGRDDADWRTEEVSTDDLVRTLSLASGLGEERYKQPAAMFLLQAYRRLQHGDDLGHATGNSDNDPAIRHANTVRSFTAKIPHFRKRRVVRLSFNISSFSVDESIRRAELRIRHISNDGDPSDKGRRTRYRVRTTFYQNGVKVARGSARIVVRRDASTDEEFMTLDITDLLQDVLKDARNQTVGVIELAVRLQPRRRHRGARSVSPLPKGDPLLVVYSKDMNLFREIQILLSFSAPTAIVRRTRSVGGVKLDARTRSSGRKCKAHDFFVDFDAIGWGKWIIYPKRFNAMRCSGRCRSPVTWKFNPTNHAILQSLMRLRNKKIPRPCCVPTKLKPISMLYYEKDEIVVRRHEQMIAARCGCR